MSDDRSTHTLADAEAIARHTASLNWWVAKLMEEYDARGFKLDLAETFGGQAIKAEADAVRELESDLQQAKAQLSEVLALLSEWVGHCDEIDAVRGRGFFAVLGQVDRLKRQYAVLSDRARKIVGRAP